MNGPSGSSCACYLAAVRFVSLFTNGLEEAVDMRKKRLGVQEDEFLSTEPPWVPLEAEGL
jgi:hypothetical protein